MQKHTNIKLRFAASRACVAALFKISVGATLGSGLRAAGLRRAMRCMGLTHFRAGAMHCAGLTHATFLKLQGAVTYTYYFKRAVRLPLKHWSKAASSRLASPPPWTAGWWGHPSPTRSGVSALLSQSRATSHEWSAAMADTPTQCASAGMCKQA